MGLPVDPTNEGGVVQKLTDIQNLVKICNVCSLRLIIYIYIDLLIFGRIVITSCWVAYAPYTQ